jgi:ABC-type uncharacterized transport system substrate-binding protein
MFIGVAAAVVIPTVPSALAQSNTKVWRIGFLGQGFEYVPPLLVDALRQLGWFEGQNIKVELRHGASADQLREMARELVQLNVDLIATSGTRAALAAKDATTTIPIVFTIAQDPVAAGLVATLARPGGNLTGFTVGSYNDKLLQYLKEAVPRVSRVAYPVAESETQALNAAKNLPVPVVAVIMRSPEEPGPFFAKAKGAKADGVLIQNDTRLIPHMAGIGREALKFRMPSVGSRREFAEAGGLLSYSPVPSELWSRSAAQIDRIFKGAKPADLPIEQSSKFELVVNLKAANEMRITVPRSVLSFANEVIQ